MPARREEGPRLLAMMGLAATSDWREAVRAVQQLPYGRPAGSGPEAVAAERRGTCSGKHALLVELMGQLAPELQVETVHRVYRVDPEFARLRWGPQVAARVPADGVVDVHTYLRVTEPGASPTIIDVTFPARHPWDGETPMPLACGDGEDHLAGQQPEIDKRRLVETHCDPDVREPFIAALSMASAATQGETVS